MPDSDDIADDLDVEVSDDDELFDGVAYFYGGRAEFCERFGAVALQCYDGGIFVYTPGKGSEPLHDFLKRQKTGVVSALKAAT